jgi:ankyrin repeat protein
MTTYEQMMNVIIKNRPAEAEEMLKNTTYNLDALDNNNHTLLYWAKSMKRHKIVDLLIRKGAKLSALELEEHNKIPYERKRDSFNRFIKVS